MLAHRPRIGEMGKQPEAVDFVVQSRPLVRIWRELPFLVPGNTPEVEVTIMQRKSCPKTIMVVAILAIALALAPSAWANPKYKVLYDFQGGKDGAGPISSLTLDAAGNLYGVTATGGEGCTPWGCGTVFELSRTNGRWAKENALPLPWQPHRRLRPGGQIGV